MIGLSSKARFTLVALQSAFTVGCAGIAASSKKDLGTAVGVVVGAIIGAAASDSDGRSEAVLIVSVIGAVLGNSFGYALASVIDGRLRRIPKPF